MWYALGMTPEQMQAWIRPYSDDEIADPVAANTARNEEQLLLSKEAESEREREFRATYFNAGEPWIPSDDAMLYAQKSTLNDLALDLGRTHMAVQSRAKLLGVTIPTEAGLRAEALDPF